MILVLLRRTIEGYFPNPQPLKIFDELTSRAGLQQDDLLEIMALSDLSHVQWVRATFARTLVAANFQSAKEVGNADPEKLYEAVVKANEKGRFYKGKVGLRDIKRLIASAKRVEAT